MGGRRGLRLGMRGRRQSCREEVLRYLICDVGWIVRGFLGVVTVYATVLGEGITTH